MLVTESLNCLILMDRSIISSDVASAARLSFYRLAISLCYLSQALHSRLLPGQECLMTRNSPDAVVFCGEALDACFLVVGEFTRIEDGSPEAKPCASIGWTPPMSGAPLPSRRSAQLPNMALAASATWRQSMEMEGKGAMCISLPPRVP